MSRTHGMQWVASRTTWRMVDGDREAEVHAQDSSSGASFRVNFDYELFIRRALAGSGMPLPDEIPKRGVFRVVDNVPARVIKNNNKVRVAAMVCGAYMRWLRGQTQKIEKKSHPEAPKRMVVQVVPNGAIGRYAVTNEMLGQSGKKKGSNDERPHLSDKRTNDATILERRALQRRLTHTDVVLVFVETHVFEQWLRARAAGLDGTNSESFEGCVAGCSPNGCFCRDSVLEAVMFAPGAFAELAQDAGVLDAFCTVARRSETCARDGAHVFVETHNLLAEPCLDELARVTTHLERRRPGGRETPMTQLVGMLQCVAPDNGPFRKSMEHVARMLKSDNADGAYRLSGIRRLFDSTIIMRIDKRQPPGAPGKGAGGSVPTTGPPRNDIVHAMQTDWWEEDNRGAGLMLDWPDADTPLPDNIQWRLVMWEQLPKSCIRASWSECSHTPLVAGVGRTQLQLGEKSLRDVEAAPTSAAYARFLVAQWAWLVHFRPKDKASWALQSHIRAILVKATAVTHDITPDYMRKITAEQPKKPLLASSQGGWGAASSVAAAASHTGDSGRAADKQDSGIPADAGYPSDRPPADDDDDDDDARNGMDPGEMAHIDQELSEADNDRVRANGVGGDAQPAKSTCPLSAPAYRRPKPDLTAHASASAAPPHPGHGAVAPGVATALPTHMQASSSSLGGPPKDPPPSALPPASTAYGPSNTGANTGAGVGGTLSLSSFPSPNMARAGGGANCVYSPALSPLMDVPDTAFNNGVPGQQRPGWGTWSPPPLSDSGNLPWTVDTTVHSPPQGVMTPGHSGQVDLRMHMDPHAPKRVRPGVRGVVEKFVDSPAGAVHIVSNALRGVMRYYLDEVAKTRPAGAAPGEDDPILQRFQEVHCLCAEWGGAWCGILSAGREWIQVEGESMDQVAGLVAEVLQEVLRAVTRSRSLDMMTGKGDTAGWGQLVERVKTIYSRIFARQL